MNMDDLDLSLFKERREQARAIGLSRCPECLVGELCLGIGSMYKQKLNILDNKHVLTCTFCGDEWAVAEGELEKLIQVLRDYYPEEKDRPVRTILYIFDNKDWK